MSERIITFIMKKPSLNHLTAYGLKKKKKKVILSIVAFYSKKKDPLNCLAETLPSIRV